MVLLIAALALSGTSGKHQAVSPKMTGEWVKWRLSSGDTWEIPPKREGQLSIRRDHTFVSIYRDGDYPDTSKGTWWITSKHKLWLKGKRESNVEARGERHAMESGGLDEGLGWSNGQLFDPDADLTNLACFSTWIYARPGKAPAVPASWHYPGKVRH